jgi:hypothetical protein
MEIPPQAAIFRILSSTAFVFYFIAKKTVLQRNEAHFINGCSRSPRRSRPNPRSWPGPALSRFHRPFTGYARVKGRQFF